MTKSFVSVGQHICIACCKQHDSSEIILDKRLRDSLESKTVTGWGMCDECKSHREQDMIALIGAEKSTTMSNGNLDLDGAYRTGDLLWMKSHAFAQIFNVPAPDKGVCFVEPEAVKQLKQMYEDAEAV